MRERVRWVCVAIVLSGAAAPAVQASDGDPAAAPAGVSGPSDRTAKLHGVRIVPLSRTGSVRVLSMLSSPVQVSAGQQGHSYDLRLARAYEGNRLEPIRRNLRARGTGMRDAYLHGSSGVRMSVGSSYHMQYRAADGGPGAAAGSAALMRLPVGAVNLRDGYESYAPVAMAGYDAALSDRMKIGVEGGMMVGRSTAMYADESVPGMADKSHVARNPVADVVMTYAF